GKTKYFVQPDTLASGAVDSAMDNRGRGTFTGGEQARLASDHQPGAAGTGGGAKSATHRAFSDRGSRRARREIFGRRRARLRGSGCKRREKDRYARLLAVG